MAMLGEFSRRRRSSLDRRAKRAPPAAATTENESSAMRSGLRLSRVAVADCRRAAAITQRLQPRRIALPCGRREHEAQYEPNDRSFSRAVARYEHDRFRRLEDDIRSEEPPPEL